MNGPRVFLLTKINPEYPDILYNPTKMNGPRVFLLTKIKPEYSEILYCTIQHISLSCGVSV